MIAFLFGFFSMSPLLFGFMYMCSLNDKLEENKDLTMKEYFITKDEDTTIVGYILFIIVFLYAFIFLNYISRFFGYTLYKIFNKS